MTKTVNRIPKEISLPNKKDVKDYFFNHYTWNGLNDDKNFLSVDQKTFNSCNNVYIDAEGLLKSRPSQKIKIVNYKEDNVVHILSDIVNVWTFEYVTVYQSVNNSIYYLTFVNNKFENNLQISLEYLDEENDLQSYKDVKLIVENQKIFVFSEYDFNYYDMIENTYNNADKFIHIPTTKVIVDGIELASSKIESENELTTSYFIKRLYTSVESVYFSDLTGKHIIVTLDGESYNINFKYNNQFVFVNKFTALSEENYSDDLIIGNRAEGIPLVFVSERGNMILCSYIYTIDNNTKIPTIQWKIYHTVDGITFDLVPDTSDIIGIPKISRDGNYCIVFKDQGPYIYSLLNTVYGGKKYSEWTNLLEYLAIQHSQTYTPMHLNTHAAVGYRFNQTMAVNGYFIDDSIFVFTWGSGLVEEDDDPVYYNMYLYERKGDRFNTAVLFSPSTTTGPTGRMLHFLPVSIPNVYCRVISGVLYSIVELSVEEDTVLHYYNSIFRHRVFDGDSTYHVDTTFITYSGHGGGEQYRAALFDSIMIKNDGRFIFAYPQWRNNRIYIVTGAPEYTNPRNWIYFQHYTSTKYNDEYFSSMQIKLGDSNCYLLTDSKLYYFDTSPINGAENRNEEPLSLLFEAKPVAFYDLGNIKNGIYVATDTELYTSASNNVIEVSELIEGENNYIIPDTYTKSNNYYFSKANKLFISAPAVDLIIDTSKNIVSVESDFKWYFPKINTQLFDFDITNLHPISNTEIAIFFEHFINYVSWDSDAQAYRYYRSKIQTGCKKGSDVITSFDGKYIIFVSDRGLVAMTYQEFMATSEQALVYLSDTIYTYFLEYISSSISTNEVKLYKYGYWIIVYKRDSKIALILDARNNSWWPVTSLYNIDKIITEDNKPILLLNGYMYDLNTKETEYFDYDGTKHNIEWHVKSQKLYLDAVNYYKHIVNLTFTSVHDKKLLEESSYNVEHLDFKLQVNNYRKRIDGNIDDDEYVSVNYNVHAARTFVQRLNYSKVNEFQYLLSSNEDNAINVPLSLSNITVKYKIGSQVR